MSRGRGNSTDERRRRYRRGHLAEYAAAAVLIAKGYRVLARRHRTPLGEIDLIVHGHGRIVFVEVKQRATAGDLEAAISEHQIFRVRNAADLWLGRNAGYREHRIGFDLMLVVPWQLPLHFVDAF